MYVGHAAFALLVKGRRPDLPLALLVPVAFGPDWVQLTLEVAGRYNRVLSHSLPAVILGAVLSVAAYRLLSKRPMSSAWAVGLLWLSHWPADVITGRKPTWPGGPEVGLALYGLPVVDLVVECLIVWACWRVYRRSLPVDRQGGALPIMVLLGLFAMQMGFDALQRGTAF